MLRAMFSSSSREAGSSSSSATAAGPKPATLLVLQDDAYDWPEIFRGSTLKDGRGIRVVQTAWEAIEVHVSTYSTAGFCVEVQRLAKTASPPEQGRPVERFPLTVKPDFVLVRNEVTAPNFDGRSRMNGLLFADVPSLNSMQSILMCCERPAMMGQLHRLQRRWGAEVFPIMPQHFASSSKCLMYGYTFPAVVKVGSAHAGAGKMKIVDHHQMSDFRTVLEMTPNQHCTVEPFVQGDADLRIQKIGSSYRAFRRRSVSGDWKTNTGTSVMDEEECTDRWRKWADGAAEMFGGLDILTVDAIVEQGTGKEYILEVNGTSSGLHPDRAAEDNVTIRDLVLERMSSLLC